ncbi:hypothetical protein LCGC14_1746730, partial [marine sediment metagenome]
MVDYFDLNKLELTEQTIKFLEAVLSASVDGIILTDNAQNIILVNEAFCNLIGENKSDLLETNIFIWLEQFDENAMIHWSELEKKIHLKNSIHDIEFKKTKNGVVRYYSVNASLLKRVSIEERGFIVSIWRDITERNKAEQKLKGSEESLRSSKLELEIKNQISKVFLTVPDAKMYVEVLSIILKTLKSEFGIFGYLDENENLVEPSLTENVWKKCEIKDKRIVFSKKLWDKNIYGRVINEKKSVYVNKFFNVPEGHVPISNFLGSPIIYDNKVIGILIVSNKETDYEENDVKLLESISDLISPILVVRLERDRIENIRQRAEQDLKNSEEKYREAYERANFYKSLFAHDIRNVLQSISSSEQIFSLFLNNPNKLKEREELLEIIRRQVNRGNILISNVQKLSQLEEIGISLKKLKIQEVLE